jgi:hypothetical protein
MLNDKGELPLDLCFKHEEKFKSRTSIYIIKRLVSKAYQILSETETLQNISNFYDQDSIFVDSRPVSPMKNPKKGDLDDIAAIPKFQIDEEKGKSSR